MHPPVESLSIPRWARPSRLEFTCIKDWFSSRSKRLSIPTLEEYRYDSLNVVLVIPFLALTSSCQGEEILLSIPAREPFFGWLSALMLLSRRMDLLAVRKSSFSWHWYSPLPCSRKESSVPASASICTLAEAESCI